MKKKIIKLLFENKSYTTNDNFTTLHKYKTQFLNLYPIRKIDFTNKTENSKHNEISKLVELIIQLHQEKTNLNLQTKIEQVQTRIEFTEKRINQIVFELYELTEEEIKIVAGK